MSQHAPQVRRLEMMNRMSFEGRKNWTLDNVDTSMIHFVEWLRKSLELFDDETIRDLLYQYYVAGKEVNSSKGDYVILRGGKQALYVLYKAQQEDFSGRSED